MHLKKKEKQKIIYGKFRFKFHLASSIFLSYKKNNEFMVNFNNYVIYEYIPKDMSRKGICTEVNSSLN